MDKQEKELMGHETLPSRKQKKKNLDVACSAPQNNIRKKYILRRGKDVVEGARRGENMEYNNLILWQKK